jgi:hypothetical protein
VPSNWFHTVENIADTISINHNWLNGANLRQCWHFVNTEVRSSARLRRNLTSENSFSDSNGTVKVDDAVLSLWHVVGAKVTSRWPHHSAAASKEEFSQLKLNAARSTNIKIDLEGILFVIDGLLALERNGFVSMSALSNVYDIIALRCEIMDLMNII